MTTSLSFLPIPMPIKEAVKNLEVYEVMLLVTPLMAQKYVSNMGPQRNLRKEQVEQYARDMLAGRWIYNGDSIVFDVHGRLRDGQTRMHAVIKSGVSIMCRHVYNATEDMIRSIDTGMKRTFGDVTRMNGIPNSTQVAATAAIWWKYQNKGFARADRPSHAQLAEIRDAHLNSLDLAIKLVRRARVARSLCGVSTISFVFAYLYERDAARAEEFLMSLDTGIGLVDGNPIYALRRVLINNASSRGKFAPTVIIAMLIKAFNYNYQHRELRNLQFRKGEEFPTFVI